MKLLHYPCVICALHLNESLMLDCMGAEALPINHALPMVGTGGHGLTYTGATMPFGFVQLSPDTRTQGWDACSGYHYSDDSIIGFSHTHLSGTGCADLGDLLVRAVTCELPAAPLNADLLFVDRKILTS